MPARGIPARIDATLRDRPVDGLWAMGWWGFDIAVLWACMHAFGSPPPLGVIVALVVASAWAKRPDVRCERVSWRSWCWTSC